MGSLSLRRRCVVGLAFALAGCHRSAVVRTTPPPSATVRIARDAARFEIDAVDDSTARFRPLESRWLRVGMSAIVVDPKNRDALVARVRIMSADSLVVTALVIGQVGRVTTDHFLLVMRPKTRWWRDRRFWFGALAGGALGSAATRIAR